MAEKSKGNAKSPRPSGSVTHGVDYTPQHKRMAMGHDTVNTSPKGAGSKPGV